MYYTITKELIDKFWSHVVKLDSGCWEYRNGEMVGRYGIICVSGGKQELAHRFSFKLHNGALNGLQVLHKCDNTRCVNPEHLFLGTQEENMLDMKSKKRSLAGSNNPDGVLLEADVVEIRTLYSTGNFSQRKLAKKFDVSQTTIHNIISRKGWKHI